jgi:hypothetical protein
LRLSFRLLQQKVEARAENNATFNVSSDKLGEDRTRCRRSWTEVGGVLPRVSVLPAVGLDIEPIVSANIERCL